MPKKETPAKATTYAAPALEKGLDILELLSSVSRPMGLSDISQAVGRSKNEIFRMLHVLEKRHYIERAQGNDLYTLTNRLDRKSVVEGKSVSVREAQGGAP